MHEKALKILERYESGTDRLLPFKPIHQYNLGIRELLKHCGIDRMVIILDTHGYNTVQKPLYEVATRYGKEDFCRNLIQTGSPTQSDSIHVGTMWRAVGHSTATARLTMR